MGAPRITYARASEAWPRLRSQVEGLARAAGVARIAELGAGANPALSTAFRDRNGFEYLLIDSSRAELDKASPGYQTFVADVAQPTFVGDASFDLVLSLSTAEHITSPHVFHANIRSMLRPGGRAFHFFSTLYALPFVINRITPERVSNRVLRVLDASREPAGRHGKFPAFYRWCRGPTARQLERFERSGFEVEQYEGWFGTPYFGAFSRLANLDDLIADFLIRHPRPLLTSYATVTLRRPDS